MKQTGTRVMRLEDFDNRHAGARAFAIGNGPSLNDMDLSVLRGEITFATNRFYRLARHVGYLPTYLCVSDPDVYREIEGELAALDCFRFIPHIGRSFRPRPPDDRCFTLPYKWGPGNWVTKERFRRTVTGTFHSGNTVMIDLVIQLAFCMGIHELYLIGCDCTKRHGRHFYDATTSSEGILRPDVVFECYRVCREVFEAEGRALVNAGIGGELDVLPRVDFAGLFRGVTA